MSKEVKTREMERVKGSLSDDPARLRTLIMRAVNIIHGEWGYSIQASIDWLNDDSRYDEHGLWDIDDE